MGTGRSLTSNTGPSTVSSRNSSSRRPRSRGYNRVASEANEEVEREVLEQQLSTDDVERGASAHRVGRVPQLLLNQRLRRSQINNAEEIASLTSNSASGGIEEASDKENEAETGAAGPGAASASASASVATSSDDIERQSTWNSNSAEAMLSLTILDFTHKKFSVSVPKDATVLQLKQAGVAVHKVPAGRQRLIYQGRLLEDHVFLKDANIQTDGLILHLFPKPRVVVVNDNKNISTKNKATCSHARLNENEEEIVNGAETGNDTETQREESGARVPTIVMDAEEAERRSQILVLGSVDYMEAQNNVKLFSFMLLIISSIELLNLMAIAFGVPQDVNTLSNTTNLVMDPTDMIQNVDDDFIFEDGHFILNQTENNTMIAGSNNTTSNATVTFNNDTLPTNSVGLSPTMTDPAVMIYQQWSSLSWVDLAISMIGVYVACLGIKATNENQLRTAKHYLWGTSLVAVAWLAYNYVVSLKVDQAIEHQQEIAKEQYQQQHNGTSTDDDYGWNNPYSNDYYGHDLTDQNLYSQAFQVMILPAMVWLLCIFRAWQFQHLLQEAEQEAENRIQQELQLNNDDGDGDEDEEQPASNTQENFSMQNPSAVIS